MRRGKIVLLHYHDSAGAAIALIGVPHLPVVMRRKIIVAVTD
jgi:hypothetical protein